MVHLLQASEYALEGIVVRIWRVVAFLLDLFNLLRSTFNFSELAVKEAEDPIPNYAHLLDHDQARHPNDLETAFASGPAVSSQGNQQFPTAIERQSRCCHPICPRPCCPATRTDRHLC